MNNLKNHIKQKIELELDYIETANKKVSEYQLKLRYVPKEDKEYMYFLDRLESFLTDLKVSCGHIRSYEKQLKEIEKKEVT